MINLVIIFSQNVDEFIIGFWLLNTYVNPLLYDSQLNFRKLFNLNKLKKNVLINLIIHPCSLYTVLWKRVKFVNLTSTFSVEIPGMSSETRK